MNVAHSSLIYVTLMKDAEVLDSFRGEENFMQSVFNYDHYLSGEKDGSRVRREQQSLSSWSFRVPTIDPHLSSSALFGHVPHAGRKYENTFNSIVGLRSWSTCRFLRPYLLLFQFCFDELIVVIIIIILFF